MASINFTILFLIANLVLCTTIVRAALNPVVFIPGDGGSQVWAKLNKTHVVHYICDKTTSDYFNIWLNEELLVPYVIDCWIDNMKLTYNNVTRKTHNAEGVQLKITGWGDSETVEWLDPSHAAVGAYFKSIANALVPLGYVRNVSLRGAPFDFRKAPNENQEYFVRLKQLIESTAAENSNEPIMLVVHSMGGPMALYFLTLQTAEWKAKYIKRLVSLSGVWGGTIKTIKVYAIGDDLGSSLLNEKVMREEQITSPSLAWLLPSKYYWKEDYVFVETHRKNYSLSNLEEYFDDIDYPDGWEMRKDVDPYRVDLAVPGVEVHCLYGTGIPTVEKLQFPKGEFIQGFPKLLYGHGDGTVNRRSLEGCLHWKTQQKQPVYFKVFDNTEHLQILHNPAVITYIADLVNTP